MNVQVDVEDSAELLPQLLNGQDDVVDVAEPRSLKRNRLDSFFDKKIMFDSYERQQLSTFKYKLVL